MVVVGPSEAGRGFDLRQPHHRIFSGSVNTDIRRIFLVRLGDLVHCIWHGASREQVIQECAFPFEPCVCRAGVVVIA